MDLKTTTYDGMTVLAKADGTPLKYGNFAQASKKMESIRTVLVENGYRAQTIPDNGRFLVSVYDAEPELREEPDLTLEEEDVRTAMRLFKDSQKVVMEIKQEVNRCPPFATVSGGRINPRNRHNHGH